MSDWQDLGPADALKSKEVQTVDVGGQSVALICKDGSFSALSGTCLHAGGPLGQGRLSGDYLVCPWHAWHYHWRTGAGRPGYNIAIPRYETKIEGGHLWVKTTPATEAKHPSHP